jgi:hypothetical protein
MQGFCGPVSNKQLMESVMCKHSHVMLLLLSVIERIMGLFMERKAMSDEVCGNHVSFAVIT